MPESKQKPKLHPANDVIAKLYSAVVDNKKIHELFSAWDTYAEHVFDEQPEEAKVWQPLLIDHFEQASSLVVVMQPSLAEEKQEFVDSQVFPAILFNSHLRLVAQNQKVEEIWPLELDADISNAILPPFNIEQLLSMRGTPINHVDPVLVSLEVGDIDQSNIVMAVIHPIEFSTGDGQSKELMFILRIAQPRWYTELGRMLSSTYGLTESEIEVARGLHQNRAISMIAKQRSRSVRTVRTQLSQVFEKTGTSSQTELISMITNLGQILELGESSKIRKSNSVVNYCLSNADVEILTCRSSEGHQLSYARYGAKNGRPILSIQPTVPPEMTERFRQAAVDSGLRFIVPYKPGSGQSSSRNYSYKPTLAASDYKCILDAEKVSCAQVLGIYSGGVYALKFADLYPAMVERVNLADTGVPLKFPSDFIPMSATVRRTFLPARLFPSVLLTPHKMVAKDFYESVSGQRRIIEYFFSGSPTDLELVKNNKEFYNITRDMIRYSFEDIKQLIDDVCIWVNDWSESLNSVAENQTIQFLHGEHNDCFMWQSVERYTNNTSHVKAIKLRGKSQLGIFVEPKILMETLNSQ